MRTRPSQTLRDPSGHLIELRGRTLAELDSKVAQKLAHGWHYPDDGEGSAPPAPITSDQ